MSESKSPSCLGNAFGCLVLLALAIVGADKPRPRSPAKPAPSREVVDTSWIPKSGDRGVILVDPGKRVFASHEEGGSGDYFDMMKAVIARDEVHLDILKTAGTVYVIDRKTAVLVIATHSASRVSRAYGPPVRVEDPPYALTVRFEDGPLKGKAAVVSDQYVVRLLTVRGPAVKKTRP